MMSNTTNYKENLCPPEVAKLLEIEARNLYESGNIIGSYKKLQVAYKTFPTPKLMRKMGRVRALLPKTIESLTTSSIDHLIAETSNLSIQEDQIKSNIKKKNVSPRYGVTHNADIENSYQDVSELLSAARLLFEEGKTSESLEKVKLAYALVPNPKTARKIDRLQVVLAEENKKIQSSSPKKLSIDDSSGPADVDTDVPVSAESDNVATEDLPKEHQYLRNTGKKRGSKETTEQPNNVDPDPKMSQYLTCHNATETEATKMDAKASKLETQARERFLQKDYPGTLQLLLKANEIRPSDKIQRRIGRLKELMTDLSNQSSNDSDIGNKDDDDAIDQLTEMTSNMSVDSKFLNLEDGKNLVKLSADFYLPKQLYDQLYPYQREGVLWLWNLHKTSPGGVLADDMGLGKTLQTIAFLTGYFLSDETFKRPYTAIILAPVSVLNTWQTEFARWAPTLKVYTYYELSKSARQRTIISLQRRGGVLLTTYHMLISSLQDIGNDQLTCDPGTTPWYSTKTDQSKKSADLYIHGRVFTYDYLILDEAHRIKNTSTKAAKAVRALASLHRLLLTGTAVQNNLRELWSLFDFTHTGRLLGTQKTFLMEYEKPIMRARERDASGAERLHGNLMANSLHKIIAPFILRRTKQDTLAKLTVTDVTKQMPRKNEIVIWVYLSPLQEKIYRNFLNLDHVKELLFGGSKRSPLVELNILKKLCDHPRLLSTDQCANLGLDVSRALPGSEIRVPSRSALIQESGKLAFLLRLLEHFQTDALITGQPAHRTLIFSQSLRLLDMAEAAILGMNEASDRPLEIPKHRVLRLDGQLRKLDERLRVLNKFASDRTYTAMLLTTQVGGVGLTITSADRVVILDPSWNPSVDAQAVDRVYRIGQRSNVVVYRLITCATVEEKIYRRQVYKDSVIRQTIGRAAIDRPVESDLNDPYRYFTRQELVELFTLDANARFSTTQRQLMELHDANERKTDDVLNAHLKFVTGMKDLVFDISDHDLLFSRQEKVEERPLGEQIFVENRLKVAEAAIHLETMGDMAAADKLRSTQQTISKPTLYQPAGEFLIPSKADSQRPMYNAPKCGTSEIQDRRSQADFSPKVNYDLISKPFECISASAPSSNPSFNQPSNLHSELSPTPVQHPPHRHPTAVKEIHSWEREPSRSIIDLTQESSSEHKLEELIGAISNNNSSRSGGCDVICNPKSTENRSEKSSFEDTDDSDNREIIFDHDIDSQQGSVMAMSDIVEDRQTPTKLPLPDSQFLGGADYSDQRFPANFAVPLHLQGPKATSSPFSKKKITSNEDEEMISLDLTHALEDDEINNSVQMISLRQSLAQSGIYLCHAPDGSIGESSLHHNANQPPIHEMEEVIITDSCCDEWQQSIEKQLSDSVEIIEASFTEN